MRVFALLAAFALALSACGGAGRGAPGVSEARVGAPTGPNAAVYFVVDGSDEEDMLVSATTDVAPEVQLHETSMGDDGTMSMEAVPSFTVPANGELVLEPGGKHLMLVGVEDLEIGATVELILTFANAGDITIEAEVVDPAETMGDHEMGDG